MSLLYAGCLEFVRFSMICLLLVFTADQNGESQDRNAIRCRVLLSV